MVIGLEWPKEENHRCGSAALTDVLEFYVASDLTVAVEAGATGCGSVTCRGN
jgi:hypothetical protein